MCSVGQRRVAIFGARRVKEGRLQRCRAFRASADDSMCAEIGATVLLFAHGATPAIVLRCEALHGCARLRNLRPHCRSFPDALAALQFFSRLSAHSSTSPCLPVPPKPHPHPYILHFHRCSRGNHAPVNGCIELPAPALPSPSAHPRSSTRYPCLCFASHRRHAVDARCRWAAAPRPEQHRPVYHAYSESVQHHGTSSSRYCSRHQSPSELTCPRWIVDGKSLLVVSRILTRCRYPLRPPILSPPPLQQYSLRSAPKTCRREACPARRHQGPLLLGPARY